MSATTTHNHSALSNVKSYILPVLIVIAGMMFAMSNLFASNAAPMPSQTHSTAIVNAEYHVSSSATGGVLGR